MAHFTYATVAASAGFAGESFNIGTGYGVTYSSTAGDAAFNVAGTITLATGTWPTWITEVGKKFVVSGTTSNNGTLTVVSVVGKVLTVVEAVTTETPVGVTVFNGSPDTAIISNLLSTGNGVLTADAPLILYCTGTLTATRTLNIAALENESGQQGGEALRGRWFILSVQNTDIGPTKKITVSASATINGAGTFDITKASDYLFYHEYDGIWRVNVFNRPGEAHAAIALVPFVAADWSAGATKNQIKVMQTGSITPGEVGPHNLKVYPHYVVQICNESLTPAELVDAEVQFDSSGNITIVKAEKAKPFNGTVLIVGPID